MRAGERAAGGAAPQDQARVFIVREIVEAHGGEVRLLSSPGQGTSFVVELPFRPPALRVRTLA